MIQWDEEHHFQLWPSLFSYNFFRHWSDIIRRRHFRTDDVEYSVISGSMIEDPIG